MCADVQKKVQFVWITVYMVRIPWTVWHFLIVDSAEVNLQMYTRKHVLDLVSTLQGEQYTTKLCLSQLG